MAYFSTHLLEQAAADAMILSCLFGLCGLLVSLLAAVALRTGIRACREPERSAGRWQINAPPAQSYEEENRTPASAQQRESTLGAVGAAHTHVYTEGVDAELEPEPEPEPEPEQAR